MIPNGNIVTYTRNGDAARLSMDDLSYFYKPNTNQLHKVTDAAADASPGDYSKYNDIKQGQADDNYGYDEIGNLVADNAEAITNVTWNVYGKIASLTKSGSLIKYVYDAAGNRIMKQTASDTTIYVRDASGNVLSVYSKPANGALVQSEMHLYGSSRIGMATLHAVADTSETLTGGFASGIKRIFTRGEKLFELSNHLGNVLVTVTDRKIAVSAGGGSIDYYKADISSANDYYPFGMQQPGRKFNAGKYRFGFNGKENDKDICEWIQDYGMRIYNSGLGRFLSVDPLTSKMPGESPYSAMLDNPINYNDPTGALPNPINLLLDALFRDFKANTTISFIEAAAGKGFFKPGSSSTANVTRLGRIYEDAVLRSLGEEKNTKPFKPALTSPKAVIPDLVMSPVLEIVDISNNSNNQRITFSNAAFIDAKFKGTVSLTPEFNPDQIKTMIDVLSNQKGAWVNGKWNGDLKASDYGMASLTFITPENGVIEPDLIKYATDKKVKLFQRTTQQDVNDESRIRVSSTVTSLNSVSTSRSAGLPSKAPGQSVDVNWETR